MTGVENQTLHFHSLQPSCNDACCAPVPPLSTVHDWSRFLPPPTVPTNLPLPNGIRHCANFVQCIQDSLGSGKYHRELFFFCWPKSGPGSGRAELSSIFVYTNPWFLYLKIHGLCTYKSSICVPTNPWFVYLQIHDSCTYNSSKFVPPFEDPLTYEVRLKGLKFVPRFPRILYPGFCNICIAKSWFFVPTYHRFLYLYIIDFCTYKSLVCVDPNLTRAG